VNQVAPVLLAGHAKNIQEKGNLILTQVNLYAQLFIYGGVPFLQSLGRDAWSHVRDHLGELGNMFSGFKDMYCKDMLPKDFNLKEHMPKFDFDADFQRLNENARAGAGAAAGHLSNEVQTITVSVLCWLGSTLLAHNRAAEAKSVLEVAVETNGSSQSAWYLLACAHSLLSLTPELLADPSQSSSLPSSVSRDEKRRKRLQDEALKCLRRAIDLGFADVDQLSRESHLFPLAHLADFQQIINILNEKKNESVPNPEPSKPESSPSAPVDVPAVPAPIPSPSVPVSAPSSSSDASSDAIESYVIIPKESEPSQEEVKQSEEQKIVENNSELEKKYNTELSFLRDMGFDNTSVNLALLVVENGNLDNVMSHLIN
jgi:hypothetical protein